MSADLLGSAIFNHFSCRSKPHVSIENSLVDRRPSQRPTTPVPTGVSRVDLRLSCRPTGLMSTDDSRVDRRLVSVSDSRVDRTSFISIGNLVSPENSCVIRRLSCQPTDRPSHDARIDRRISCRMTALLSTDDSRVGRRLSRRTTTLVSTDSSRVDR